MSNGASPPTHQSKDITMTTPKATRTLIRVTNNQDEGKGSLRDAIRQGNEAVNKGNAVEIVFTSSLHIKAKSSYVLEKGDWLFNERLTKNIIVDNDDKYINLKFNCVCFELNGL